MTAQDSDFDHVSVDLPEGDAADRAADTKGKFVRGAYETDVELRARIRAELDAYEEPDDDEPDDDDPDVEPYPDDPTVGHHTAKPEPAPKLARPLTLNDVPPHLRGRVKVLLRQAVRKYGTSYTQRLLKRFAKAGK